MYQKRAVIFNWKIIVRFESHSIRQNFHSPPDRPFNNREQAVSPYFVKFCSKRRLTVVELIFAITERQVQNFRALFDSEYTFKFVYGCLGERRLWYLFRQQMGGGSLARKVLTIFNPMERAISHLFGMHHLGSFISQEKIRISLR